MQHAQLVRVAKGVEQGHGDALQLGPGQALGALRQQLIEGQALEQLQGEEGALARYIHLEAEQAHHMGMGQAGGQGEFAVEQGVGVRVFGEIVAQGFQRHIGLGVAELFAQQVAGPIHRAHAADPEQALDLVAPTEHLRQLAGGAGYPLRGDLGCGRSGGQGEVGEVAGGGRCRVEQGFAHAGFLIGGSPRRSGCPAPGRRGPAGTSD